MAKLLIVESPGKIKTLRRILGPGWILEASVGHTTELARDGEKHLGFDLDLQAKRVRTRYVPRGDRGREVLAKLKAAVTKAERVYLAMDPDREGEAIAWHLVQQLKLGDYARVSYTQITENAVRDAIERPGKLDLRLVDSQRARQCLDKLVGFEVSPLLWSSTGGKSAGRVQSSTLHLVCERERERLAFKPEQYWTLKARYREGFEATYEVDPGVTSEAEASLIAEVARSSPHVVTETETKDELRSPPPPFITSSLQQMAGARFKYSPQKTMQIAQELYEGIRGKGLITYMRTDSTALSPEFVEEGRAWLLRNFPESRSDRPTPTAVRSSPASQGAHEAIRPTSAALAPAQAAATFALSREQLNLYTLIWERAIASLCKPARLSKTRIVIDCAGTRWVARGMTVVDPGYLRFWKNTEDEKLLPALRPQQELSCKEVRVEKKSTEPPPRFTEPKLVQLMEKRGIGRPSTYASTVTTLKDREYVRLEKQFLVPTELGMATDEALGRALPELIDADFTARMERSLDEIAEGTLGWESYLCDWNQTYFAQALGKAAEVLRGTRRVAPAPKPGPRREATRQPSSRDSQKPRPWARPRPTLPNPRR